MIFNQLIARLFSRQATLIAGTLLIQISPHLCILFYVFSALAVFGNWKQLLLTKEQLFISVSIILISAWLLRTPSQVLWNLRPIYDITSRPIVNLGDYIPLFLYFYSISLKVFSALEAESFCWALALTSPCQLLLIVGERYGGLQGLFTFPSTSFPAINILFDRPYYPRPIAGFFNPNLVGCYALISASVTVCLLINQKEKVKKIRSNRSQLLKIWIILTCLACSLLILLWAASKGSWIAFGISLVAFAIYVGIDLKYVVAGGLSLGTILIIAFSSLGGLTEVARRLIPQEILVRLSEPPDLSRMSIYECANSLVKEKPLIDWGIGNFSSECSKRIASPTDHAHNIFLQLTTELGIPAIIAITCFLGYIFFRSTYYLF